MSNRMTDKRLAEKLENATKIVDFLPLIRSEFSKHLFDTISDLAITNLQNLQALKAERKRISELEAQLQAERAVNVAQMRDRKELKDEIRELQMFDPHLEFISRVQDVGLQQEWNDFCDRLVALEGEQE